MQHLEPPNSKSYQIVFGMSDFDVALADRFWPVAAGRKGQASPQSCRLISVDISKKCHCKLCKKTRSIHSGSDS